jgi:hypothetical protein
MHHDGRRDHRKNLLGLKSLTGESPPGRPTHRYVDSGGTLRCERGAQMKKYPLSLRA